MGWLLPLFIKDVWIMKNSCLWSSELIAINWRINWLFKSKKNIFCRNLRWRILWILCLPKASFSNGRNLTIKIYVRNTGISQVKCTWWFRKISRIKICNLKNCRNFARKMGFLVTKLIGKLWSVKRIGTEMDRWIEKSSRLY